MSRICGRFYLEVSVTLRNIALHFVTMREKRENCKYCDKKLEDGTTRKEFCSDKCRVYWNRDQKAIDKHIANSGKPIITPTVQIMKETAIKDIMTINKIKDSCPKELKGWARTTWIHEEKKKYGI